MAVTVTLYNQAAAKLASQTLTLANFKCALLNGYSFDATETAWSDVSGSEVSGNGWDAGGEALANVAVTTTTTNDGKLDADDLSVTATGGSIGPADGAVIYDSTTTGTLLAYISFGGSQEAGVGTDFKINWATGGIFTWTVT